MLTNIGIALMNSRAIVEKNYEWRPDRGAGSCDFAQEDRHSAASGSELAESLGPSPLSAFAAIL